jgi:hypothetical protein
MLRDACSAARSFSRKSFFILLKNRSLHPEERRKAARLEGSVTGLEAPVHNALQPPERGRVR